MKPVVLKKALPKPSLIKKKALPKVNLIKKLPLKKLAQKPAGLPAIKPALLKKITPTAKPLIAKPAKLPLLTKKLPAAPKLNQKPAVGLA